MIQHVVSMGDLKDYSLSGIKLVGFKGHRKQENRRLSHKHGTSQHEQTRRDWIQIQEVQYTVDVAEQQTSVRSPRARQAPAQVLAT